jgi:hypothetical protein
MAAVEEYRRKRSTKMHVARTQAGAEGEFWSIFAWEAMALRLMQRAWALADHEATSGWNFAKHAPSLLHAQRSLRQIRGSQESPTYVR